MKIVVHGQELAALVTAVSLAASGRDVVLACGSARVAAELGAGRLPFEEPGLAAALAAAQREGRLVLGGPEDTADWRGVIVHFLALGQDDIEAAGACVDAVATHDGDLLLVNQVNYGVGVTDALLARLQAHRAAGRHRTAAASLPDFLRRGSALANFQHPDRVILGVGDPWAEGLLREVLRPFTGDGVPVLVMPARDAEFTKQAVNGMLATRLSYMNDMANVADALGIDIENVRQGVGSDERIGHHFLQPGCGFGGTGFYQDLLSLKRTLDASAAASRLVDTALAVNEEQKELLFRKLWRHWQGRLAGRTVAVWGAAFKPDTDRVDHAPSLSVVSALLAQGVTVRVHDPKALGQLREHIGPDPRLVEVADPYAAAEGAEALLLLTEWPLYRGADLERLRARMAAPLLLDGRNVIDPLQARTAGFTYDGVGRR